MNTYPRLLAIAKARHHLLQRAKHRYHAASRRNNTTRPQLDGLRLKLRHAAQLHVAALDALDEHEARQWQEQ